MIPRLPVDKPERLGERLLAAHRLNDDQLRIALGEQKRQPEPLGQILLRLGFLNEHGLLETLGEALAIATVDLGTQRPEPAALARLPAEFARRHRVIPLRFDQDARQFTLAMIDPADVVALDQCRALLPAGVSVRPVLASAAGLEAALEQAYGVTGSVSELLRGLDPSSTRGAAGGAAANLPVTRLVDALLAEAVRLGASDIHCEPEAGALCIRLRIDGVLRPAHTLHRDYWPPLAVRLKVLAGLDIAESQAPQDGRFSLALGGRPLDFRVSSLPTSHGENLVLRVLDRQRGILPLAALGLDDDSLAAVHQMLASPSGLVLVCGPTGAGKTTTLYSFIKHLDSSALSIMTLEDPVEYPLPGIRQTSLGEALRMDFASGVRALLRQDPDVLLIGEIRDEDTAAMALRAAMTGHQVFSTLHANSVLGAIPRLTDLGVRPSLLAASLTGLIAQRLVRALRPECRTWGEPTAVERRQLGLALDAPAHVPRATTRGVGGPAAYSGRLAVMEILPINRALEALLAAGASRQALEACALANGFVPLVRQAQRRVLAGLTTLDEVARVIDFTGREA